MSNITLRQLEHFVATVEEGSVSAAAARLHVSPGAVSLALSDLESVLRVRLMSRQRGKGITLTVGGRAVLEHARNVLATTDALVNAAGDVRGRLVGPLSVGCFTPLSSWLVPPLVAHFTVAHPAVELAVVEGSWDDLAGRLRAGLLDVALLYSAHTPSDFESMEVIPVTPRVLLSPDHPLAGHDHVALADLVDEPAILLHMPPSGDVTEAALAAVGFAPQVRFRSSNVETIRAMVARGLGYSITMGRPATRRVVDGLPLVYRPLVDDLPPNAVVAARTRGATRTVKVEALIAAAREQAAASVATGIDPAPARE